MDGDETTRAIEPGSSPWTEPRADEASLRPGDVLGRYEIEASIGRGGMGEVYAARDGRLDRRVALKVLRARLGEADEDGPARLLGEAQALARLAHPNVVEIFDVGVAGGRVFLAMELIEGQTLREWLRQGNRSWRDVLEAFMGAARGLGAAHAAGLVHGDFKPSNVLVGPGARVRVVDFGLATTLDDGRETSPLGRGAAGEVSYRSGSSRVIAGTPRYMAPEQWQAGAVDARSDQFAFCVALYEALYGRPPFDERRLVPGEDWAPAAPHGPPRGRAVPRAIWAALERGMAHAPEHRHASMEALGRALATPGWIARAWIAVPVVVGVTALATWWIEPPVERGDPCENGHEGLAAAWGPESAERVREALVAADAVRGPQAAERVTQRLDARAAAWAEVHAAACTGEATAERELRLACLDDRLVGLRALVEVLEQADAKVVGRAVQAVGALEDPRTCAEPQALHGSLPPPDPALAETVADLRARLSAARAEEGAGRYEAAHVALDALAAEAEAVGYPPLGVELLDARAHNADARGDWTTAEALLERAVNEARAIGHDRVLASASIQLVYVVGSELGRADDGLGWVRHAEAALERLGPEQELRAELALYHGIVLDQARRLPEARARLEQALALAEASLGDDDPDLANPLNSLGIVCYRQGETDAALGHLRRAHDLVRRTLGPDHDRVAAYGANIAGMLTEQGDHAGARRWLEDSLAIWDRTVALRHPAAANALRNLGIVHEALGDLEAARAAFERARDLSLALVGPEHPDYGQALNSLGVFHRTRGELAAARTSFEQALPILQEALGDEHPEVAMVSTNLGAVASELGDHAVALDRLARALPTLEQHLGPEHPLLVDVLRPQARSLAASGREGDAIAALERAVRIAEQDGVAPEQAAEVRRALAELREREPGRAAPGRMPDGHGSDGSLAPE